MTPHVHGSAAAEHRGRLAIVFALTLSLFAIELIGGIASNSLALLADAWHLFTDVAEIGLALLAIWFAGRPASDTRTFGYLRLEVPRSSGAPRPGPGRARFRLAPSSSTVTSPPGMRVRAIPPRRSAASAASV